ncbi:LysM peptidoglycan-binding domain-containing protein, partial [Staphylococcus aureus]|uniref:LysM peptidoglycan-binding domain-containing protein n=1 Tax=Staphylococcus aureus TaxID=1280 RepID=UPI001F5BDD21
EIADYSIDIKDIQHARSQRRKHLKQNIASPSTTELIKEDNNKPGKEDGNKPGKEDNNKPGKEDGNGVHVVKPGDTVNDIAKANGTTADKIAADNKLADKNMIKPGQELVVDKKQPANHADANKAQALPETGEENPFIGTTVFGGLSLALGAALLAGRRREL